MLSRCRQVGRVAILARAPNTRCIPSNTTFSAIRSLSSTANIEKLRDIFREYKRNNFPQELPSRIWKELLRAMDQDGDGYITIQEAEDLLENIGASDKVTTEELSLALQELGGEEDKIEVRILRDLLSDQRGM